MPNRSMVRGCLCTVRYCTVLYLYRFVTLYRFVSYHFVTYRFVMYHFVTYRFVMYRYVSASWEGHTESHVLRLQRVAGNVGHSSPFLWRQFIHCVHPLKNSNDILKLPVSLSLPCAGLWICSFERFLLLQAENKPVTVNIYAFITRVDGMGAEEKSTTFNI